MLTLTPSDLADLYNVSPLRIGAIIHFDPKVRANINQGFVLELERLMNEELLSRIYDEMEERALNGYPWSF